MSLRTRTNSKVENDVKKAIKSQFVTAKALRKVFYMQKSLLQNCSNELTLERFYHPGKRENAYFLTGKDEQILEVLEFDEPRRSWLIASEICSNGKLYITTPVDTLLFALHYVRKYCATKALSWDCLGADLEASSARFLSKFVRKSQLPLIADEKAVDDVCYYKYNPTRSLAWLAIKARTLAAALLKQQIHCGQYAQSAHFNPAADEVEQLDKEKNALIMACDIVGSYLDLDLSQQLLKYFNISEITKEVVENKQKRKSKNQINDSNDSKKAKVENDCMEYAAIKPVTPAKTLTTKEKQLAKGAKGSKSISSFFAKKS